MSDPFEVDRWLDDALAHYVNVEPRPGLENRMLAQVVSRTRSRRTNYWWSFAMATATLALLFVWLRPAVQSVPPPDVHWSVVLPPPTQQYSPRIVSRRAIAKFQNVVVARISSGPKLDHFPSSSPLTEQERMLVRFAQDFPQRAILMAQAETDLQREQEKEMSKPWPTEAANNSKQE